MRKPKNTLILTEDEKYILLRAIDMYKSSGIDAYKSEAVNNDNILYCAMHDYFSKIDQLSSKISDL
jgi:hypothetical protein